MTLWQFAKNNILRNKEIYFGYWLSIVFTVLVFFIFSINRFHPELNGGGGAIATIMQSAQLIVLLFSIIFLILSTYSFLNQRTHTFGVILMMGMPHKQLRKMLLAENLLIGLSALIAGLIIGNVFGHFMVMIMAWIIKLSEISYVFPFEAIALTILCFTVIFVIVAVLQSRRVLKQSILDMMQTTKDENKELNFSKILAFLSIIFLIVGYLLSNLVRIKEYFPSYENTLGAIADSNYIHLIIGGCITLGMFLFFSQFSVFFINQIRKNKGYFYRNDNALWLSELMYKIKSNATTMFMTALLLTGAFIVVIATVALDTTVDSEVSLDIPFDLVYYSFHPNQNQRQDLELIQSELEQNAIQYDLTEVETIQYGESGSDSRSFISEIAYNQLAANSIDLSDNQALIIPNDSSPINEFEPYNVQVIDNKELNVIRIGEKVFDNYRFRQLFVVSDQRYNELSKNNDYQMNAFIYQFESSITSEQNRKVSQSIRNQLNNEYPGERSFIFVNRISVLDLEHWTYQVFTYIGVMLSIIFLIAAGSILYFRILSNIRGSIDTYKGLHKFGLSVQQIQTIQRKQLFTLFLMPIAFTVMNTLFAMNLLSSMLNSSIVIPFLLTLLVLIVLEVCYLFVLSRRFKTKIEDYLQVI